MRTIRACDPRLFADAGLPFVAARRGIAGLPALALPAQRIDIRAAPKQASEQGDLLASRKRNVSGGSASRRSGGRTLGNAVRFQQLPETCVLGPQAFGFVGRVVSLGHVRDGLLTLEGYHIVLVFVIKYL